MLDQIGRVSFWRHVVVDVTRFGSAASGFLGMDGLEHMSLEDLVVGTWLKMSDKGAPAALPSRSGRYSPALDEGGRHRK